MGKETNKNDNPKSSFKSFLGNYPGKTLHRLGTTLGGLWVSSQIINLAWPLPDQISTNRLLTSQELQLAKISPTPISILLIHQNISRRKELKEDLPIKRKKPLRLALIKIYPDEPIQFLKLPMNIQIVSRKRSSTTTLKEIYEEGGINHTADIVADILKLSKDEPQRYLITKPGIIAAMVNSIGGIMLSKEKEKYEKPQNTNRFISSSYNTKKINGIRAENLLLYPKVNSDRLAIKRDQEIILRGFWEKLKDPNNYSRISSLITEIIDHSNSNLTREELVSLAITAIRNNHPPVLRYLPESFPRSSHGKNS